MTQQLNEMIKYYLKENLKVHLSKSENDDIRIRIILDGEIVAMDDTELGYGYYE